MTNIEKSDSIVYKVFVWQRHNDSWYTHKTKSGNAYFSTYQNASKALRNRKGKIVQYQLTEVEEGLLNVQEK